jgi:hypothetical protein
VRRAYRVPDGAVRGVQAHDSDGTEFANPLGRRLPAHYRGEHHRRVQHSGQLEYVEPDTAGADDAQHSTGRQVSAAERVVRGGNGVGKEGGLDRRQAVHGDHSRGRPAHLLGHTSWHVQAQRDNVGAALVLPAMTCRALPARSERVQHDHVAHGEVCLGRSLRAQLLDDARNFVPGTDGIGGATR